MTRTCLVLLLVAMMTSCNSDPPKPPNYSPEFTKSAKYTWALLQQASEGQPVREADLSVAFAQLEPLVHTIDETSAKLTLQTYRLELQRLNYNMTKKEQKELFESMKQKRCEVQEMLNNGTAAYQASKDCGENLP